MLSDEPDLTRELDEAEAIVMGDATGPVVTEPYIEEIYPLAQKIEHGQRSGGKVYRRRVIVVEDWAEVAPVPPEGKDQDHGVR